MHETLPLLLAASAALELSMLREADDRRDNDQASFYRSNNFLNDRTILSLGQAIFARC
jgi:hypothetical protein